MRRAAVWAFLSVGILTGCASGSPTRVMRPTPPRAAEALERTGRCESTGASTSLVVDLPTSERVELERAVMQKAAVLVSYDCNTGRLRPLPACSPWLDVASFRYEGVTAKADVVRMTDDDSVRAKLPAAGALLATKLEGELARGSSLDLALVTVGRFVARPVGVSKPDLPRGCEGATHFISRATVGAFAMSVGSRASARAAAEIFGGGGAAESASAKSQLARDGSLDACTKAKLLEASPPDGCRALLEVSLTPLDVRSEARARCEDREDVAACQKWAWDAFSDDGDSKERALVVDRLATMCTKKHILGACMTLDMHAQRRSAPPVDVQAIRQTACDLGSGAACARLADLLDKSGNPAGAFSVLQSACSSGRADRHVTCFDLATRIRAGEGPEPKEGRAQAAGELMAHVCAWGASVGCGEYAKAYARGVRARGDFSDVKKLLDECEVPTKDDALSMRRELACNLTAFFYTYGLGVSRDAKRAHAAWAVYCNERNKDGSTSCPPMRW